MATKDLQRVLDHYGIGRIIDFNQSSLSLFSGRIIVPYYTVKTNQGVFYVFEFYWMEGDGEAFDNISLGNLGKLKKLYYSNYTDIKKTQYDRVHLKDRYFKVYMPD